MERTRIFISVVASRRFLWIAVTGLVLLCAFGADVPQGLGDDAVRATWPLAQGPFMAALGLNHLGQSPLLWLFLAAVGMHLVGARMTTSANDTRRADWLDAIAALALAGTLAALVAHALLAEAPSTARDTTRLEVEAPDAAGKAVRQVVDEGQAYQVAGPDGDRTLLFATASLGPYAAERTAQGAVRAWLPGEKAPAAALRVSPRRPSLAGPEASGFLPLGLSAGMAFLSTLVAALALVAAGRRVPALGGQANGLRAVLLGAVVVLANPWTGLGRMALPLAGGDGVAAWLLQVQGPGDVAPWLGYVSIRVPLLAGSLAGIAAFALGIAGLVLAAGGIGGDRAPRALSTAAGIAALASGLAALGYGLFRVSPGIGTQELLARFKDEVLPRVPMAVQVTGSSVSSAGPYAVDFGASALPFLAAAGLGVALLLAAARDRARSDRFADAVLAGLLAIALLRPVVLAFGPSVPFGPAGALPVALVGGFLAALAVLLRRVHPDREADRLGLAIAAASSQLLLAWL